MELSRLERLMLMNQFSILKHLEGTDDYDDTIEILRCGYSVFYSGIGGSVYEGMSQADCRFVLDVLSMYRVLDRFYEDNDASDLKEQSMAEFAGFDGNNETSLLGFTRFLVDKQGKFAEQAPRRRELDGFNSHWTYAPTYSRMLRVFKELDTYKPTREQVEQILNAAKAHTD